MSNEPALSQATFLPFTPKSVFVTVSSIDFLKGVFGEQEWGPIHRKTVAKTNFEKWIKSVLILKYLYSRVYAMLKDR